MDWLGAPITDHEGRAYARLDELFVGRSSGQPEFGIVSLTGEEGRVAVPLEGARHAPDGSLVLGVDPEHELDAPRMQRDVEEIPAGAGDIIRHHFGIEREEPATTAMPRPEATRGEEPTEVVRHEEQLAVGTRAEATERVRVRKRVVTEEVTLTVTLRREELVLEREPIAPGQAGGVGAEDPTPAAAAFVFAEEGTEAEFVLHAEEPVVTKRIVAVERVRLHRETTTEDRHITDTVRKERIDVDQLPPTREDTTP